MLFKVLHFSCQWVTYLNFCGIKKLSPFPLPSFVYPFYLFFSAFPYHLYPSPPEVWLICEPKTICEGSWYNIHVVAMWLPQFALSGDRPPDDPYASGCLFSHQEQMHFSMNLLYLFAIPFLTRGSCCFLLQWHWFHFLLPLQSTLINKQCHLWGSKFPSLCHSLGSVFVTLVPWKKL